jgi:hypothetical protein
VINQGRSEQPFSSVLVAGDNITVLGCLLCSNTDAHLLCRQEEGVMLMQLRDYSDEAKGPGFVPIPGKEAKRARTKLLPGSCLIIQPMPSNPGACLPKDSHLRAYRWRSCRLSGLHKQIITQGD